MDSEGEPFRFFFVYSTPWLLASSEKYVISTQWHCLIKYWTSWFNQ
jgi:hypothetical protein